MSSLHSTVICFDSSDFMRNEDYLPSRLHSQMDCVQLLCRSKIRAHPQNEIGLMTISDNVEVLSTLTNNVGAVLTKMNMIKPKGDLRLLTGLRIAHLVLRNRQQKDHKMRITVFVGSPILENIEQFTQLAKKFKKEKVHVDIVLMGEYESNEKKLTSFISTLNGTETSEENASHLIVVPPGMDMSSKLMSSPLLPSESAGTMRSPEFLDDDDADLALALRISLEEQRALEAEQRRQQAESTNKSKSSKSSSGSNKESKNKIDETPATPPPTTDNSLPNFDNMTEEEMIAFALNLSAEEARRNEPPKDDSKKKSKK